MKITSLTTDDTTLAELGRRMAELRLARPMTQAQLAAAAGVSKRTVERLENGAGGQLVTLIRCLRALDRLENLERLLPETPPNPIGLLERRGRERQRARPRDDNHAADDNAAWTWGDET